jgi:hypothetical protein
MGCRATALKKESPCRFMTDKGFFCVYLKDGVGGGWNKCPFISFYQQAGAARGDAVMTAGVAAGQAVYFIRVPTRLDAGRYTVCSGWTRVRRCIYFHINFRIFSQVIYSFLNRIPRERRSHRGGRDADL